MSETPETKFHIRKAALQDAEAIARVHVDAWRSTYASILPSEFLATLSYTDRAADWRRGLQVDRMGQSTLVAEIANEVVGFVATGPEREKKLGYTGEIYAIYLLEEVQGRGIGRALFHAAVKQLLMAGMDSLLAWVVQANPATGFYQAMGGQVVGEKVDEIGGGPIKELAYGWPDLKTFSLKPS